MTDDSSFDNPTFIALRDRWYARLVAAGFKDIELPKDNGPDTELRTSCKAGVTTIPANTQGEYYTAAQGFLWAHDWQMETPRALAIWELHSDGKRNRQIMKALRIRSHRLLQTTINNLRAKMLIWLDKEHDQTEKEDATAET